MGVKGPVLSAGFFVRGGRTRRQRRGGSSSMTIGLVRKRKCAAARAERLRERCPARWSRHDGVVMRTTSFLLTARTTAPRRGP
ncbi:MAG: hypothetical protein BGO98_25495 [Myxococcales bacterium 68-20]|nr:MAG: hypothetical protein BGO98_25495 [Myxococcales bacterium 68-20]